MRWTISPGPGRSDKSTGHDGTEHDPRQLDMLCIIALVIVIIGAWRYLADSTTLPPTTTSYIVPSQSVHW